MKAINPTNQEIKNTFIQVYKGHKNFLTPYIYSYGYSLANVNLFFEVSHGRFLDDHLVGVTVIEMPEKTKRHDLNKCFSGDNKYNLIGLAREYGESLE